MHSSLTAILKNELISDAELRNVIQLTGKDAQFRSETASRPETWQLLRTRLDSSLPARDAARASCSGSQPLGESAQVLLLLLLANNLSATETAGGASLPSQFGEFFAPLAFSEEKETRLQWQILANLSQGIAAGSGADLGEWMRAMGSVDALYARSPSVLKPMLLFLNRAFMLGSNEDIFHVCFDQALLRFLLEHAQQWFDVEGNEFDMVVESVVSILLITLDRGLLPRFFDKVQSNLEDRVTLLKLVDSALASKRGGARLRQLDFWNSPHGADLCNPIRLGFIENNTPVIGLINGSKTGVSYQGDNGRSDKTAQLHWSLHCILLELLGLIIPYLPATLLDQVRDNLLHELIALLKAAKMLPSRSKLKDVMQNKAEAPNSADFPYLKSAAIPVITSLVKGNQSAQDEMRVSGGLNAVLESCIIDANNPYMKERAIVCLRFLLENNSENQLFVASMEARQVADPDVLAEAGYEAEVVDGKLRVKSG